MNRSKVIRKLISERKGGIDSIIAMVVGIVLVLGLISYAVLSQVSGAKDTGDKAMIEQDKVNLMLQNPDIVTGNVVKRYYEQMTAGGYTVTVNLSSGTFDITKVTDEALFEEAKTYNANGSLSQITYTQVDLGR